MSAVNTGFGRRWRAAAAAFRRWRGGRPFWGGLWAMLGGVELLLPTFGPLEIRVVHGVAGIGTIALSMVVIALALISWFHVQLRPITGVLIVLSGLISYVVSNLGGFIVGMVLIVVGGSLIFAWRPGDPARGSDAGRVEGDQAPSENTTELDRRARPIVAPLLVLVVALAGSLLSPGVARADPLLPWPIPDWPPPSGQPEPEPDTDPGDEPDEPSGTEPESDADCDPEALPDEAPEPGGSQAKDDAEALAACWRAESGPERAQERELPGTGRFHPTIKASTMTMSGAESGGVVNVPTSHGPERALEFTMDSLRLDEMDQSSGISGTDARLHVMNPGGEAELDGDVRLYVRSVEGRLYGAVPVTLTADTPPPVMVPELVITDVETVTLYVRADGVELPNLDEPTR